MHKKPEESFWTYWKIIWSDDTESRWVKLDREMDRVSQITGFILVVVALLVFPFWYLGIQWMILLVSQLLIWLPVYCYWQEDKWDREWERERELRRKQGYR